MQMVPQVKRTTDLDITKLVSRFVDPMLGYPTYAYRSGNPNLQCQPITSKQSRAFPRNLDRLPRRQQALQSPGLSCQWNASAALTGKSSFVVNISGMRLNF